ncbi:MAG: hypothetical protein H6558_15520 [Lewinellaceae bacterium]|nr:hypothetical protein [Lewinellaceae bacterium]
MFKTTIAIQQHTPIIHFQHDQDGATLRATEVKPKLDKFIYSRFKLLFPGEKELHKSVELFNPENRANSSYKLRISNPYQAEKILVASYLKKGYRNLLNEHNIPFLHNMPYFAQESEINKLFSEDGAFSGGGRRQKV